MSEIITVGLEVGPVVDTYQENVVLVRKHASGSFTALVGGVPYPARQYLLSMRDAMGLPEKRPAMQFRLSQGCPLSAPVEAAPEDRQC